MRNPDGVLRFETKCLVLIWTKPKIQLNNVMIISIVDPELICILVRKLPDGQQLRGLIVET
jgi:hypothetical protein